MSEYLNQYRKFKESNPTFIMFFRIGDFYEIFNDDAVLACRILGLSLATKNGIPMAGIPVANVECYLRRMIAAGHRCAICDKN